MNVWVVQIFWGGPPEVRVFSTSEKADEYVVEQAIDTIDDRYPNIPDVFKAIDHFETIGIPIDIDEVTVDYVGYHRKEQA